ncbi:hypothetical protein DDZ14_17930 [Maritimibacter sp. 55A14]|uniref:glycosyltransferase family 2 protein n=1 Tax=Maritimibacter sp. 55A14 TaxID=2174844 RepID=UPI000D6128C7|nr:glycosyltransferase family 2 protein [Maritimibacter sp. 55A14]PWE29250.1 hypothetical protein DDZ14_17930 [Maritimibacter sp. 55A14]
MTPSDADNTARQRTALACCMRNEGPFVVEWAAYHSLLGFDEILVFTNDCTDGSDLLLDRLKALGYLTHIRQAPPPGGSPQIEAMKLAFADPRVQACEWLLHIDSDEFLNITCGDGSVRALLDAVGDCDVIAILWRLFGDNGVTRWDGGSVLQQFTAAQPEPMRRTVDHKSMFRHALFEFAIDHMPKLPRDPERAINVKTTAGEAVNGDMLRHRRKSRYKMSFRHATFRNACINHYAVKSEDVWLMKNDRGDGFGNAHQKYFRNSRMWNRYNRGEAQETSILRRWPEIAARMEAMRADPELRRIEVHSLAVFRARRDAVLTPEQIARWTHDPEKAL